MPQLSRKPASKRLIPWLVAIAFLMQSLDTTVLNTAVPSIAHALNVSQLEMKSVLASYALSLAVFIPASGWVADRFGTRNVFAAAIALFTLGSVLCGLSSNVTMLMIFRILQGMGGAMMVPVGRLIMVRSFGKDELVRAMSFVAIPSMIGPLIGPTLGGFIVSVTSWDYIFYLNVPIGLVGLVLVYLYLPNYREPEVPPLDIMGLVYFGIGISLLSWVLEVFGSHSTSSATLIAASLVSLTLLFLYWRHARKLLHPLLDVSLLKIRTFAVSVSGGFVTRLGVGGAPFLLPLLYQTGLGFTPVQSGLLMMPQALGALSSKIFVQYELSFFGYRSLLIGNTVLLGIMLVLFGTIGPQTPVWLICLQAVIYGILMSTQFTAMNTLTYADVPDRQASAASSFAGTFQQLSISFGIAAAGLVTASFVDTTTVDSGAMLSSVHRGFWMLGAVTIVSAGVFLFLRRNDGANVSGHQAKPGTGPANNIA
ncbi:MAG: DHA2 family efflux MFS transporter permease subunit [Rhodobacteraceae bacterium]|jgi:EmrB/QacA subfamily drug resistance transporter|nr:DHA2 family efflux MFS transporter permease subunit [Paracoccaceae bacterium]